MVSLKRSWKKSDKTGDAIATRGADDVIVFCDKVQDAPRLIGRDVTDDVIEFRAGGRARVARTRWDEKNARGRFLERVTKAIGAK